MNQSRRHNPFGIASKARRIGAAAALATGVLVPGLSTQPALAQYQIFDKTPGLKNEVPAPVKGMEIQNKLGEKIPLDIELVNAAGKKVKIGDYFNRPAKDKNGVTLGYEKPVVLIMVYFRCKLLCPMVIDKFTTTLRDVDFTAGREYDAVVVSFDHRDSYTDAASQQASQLMMYDRGNTDDVRAGWNFLVGEPENTRRLGNALGFPFRFISEAGEYAHGTAVFILTPDGRIARELTGLNYPSKDVRLALLEASQGRIGSTFDKFTMWCFHFDPNAGSYSLQAMRLMQVGGVGGTLLLGGVIGGYLWREKRRRSGRGGKGGGAAMSGGGAGAGLGGGLGGVKLAATSSGAAFGSAHTR